MSDRLVTYLVAALFELGLIVVFAVILLLFGAPVWAAGGLGFIAGQLVVLGLNES